MSEMYMLLIIEKPIADNEVPQEYWDALDRRHEDFTEAIEAAGATVVHSRPLETPDTAVTFAPNPDGGAHLVVDGPFAEAREVVMGYYVLDVRDEAQARELAAICPTSDFVELRKIGQQ
jgi:hypothetical protein